MRGAGVVLLLAVIVIAGCISPQKEEAAEAGAEAASAPPATSASKAPGAKPESAPTSTPAAARTTSAPLPTGFVWHGNATFGDLALSVHLSAPTPTSCDYDLGASHRNTPAGAHFAAGMVSAKQAGFGGGSGGSLASIHVQDTSTDDITATSGDGASGVGGGMEVDVAGVDIFLAATDVAPADQEIEFMQGSSVFVNVSCKGPIVASALQGSHEIALYTLGQASSGVGARAILVGVGAADIATLDVASPRAVGWIFAGGGVGQLHLETPDGAKNGPSSPVDFGTLFAEGGPGAWSVGVDAYATPLGGASGAILGLAPIASWDDLAL